MSARRNLVAVLLATLVPGCAERPPARKVLTPVRVSRVEVTAADGATRYTANVEPLVRVDLAFKRGGYIDELLQVRGADGTMRKVQEGDLVARGQVLARIHDADYRVKLAQARGALAQAEAAMAQARMDLQRAQPLYDGKAIPKTTMDGATNKYNGTQGGVDLYRATVREAELALEDTALKAPIDGTVMKRLIEVGSLVGPGVGGFVVADLRSVKVVFGVPDSRLERFPIGTELPVHVDAVGADLVARVTRVSTYADPRNRAFDIEVTLPNPDGRLKAGMIAAVTTAVSPADSAAAAQPSVPLEAVVRPPGAAEGYAVYVIEELAGVARAKARKVALGEVRGSRIGIADGLAPGDRVVVSGAAFVVDGAEITIQP